MTKARVNADNASADIQGVTAGTGLTGGGTSGTVTVTNSMATAIDAKGDLVAGTGADAFARLAVGTNGQVLTANSATATGLEFATVASGGMTSISSGSLTGSTFTISSIAGTFVHLQLVIRNYRTNTDGSNLQLRFNSDSNTRYKRQMAYGNSGVITFNENAIAFGAGQSNVNSNGISVINIFDYTNTTSYKLCDFNSINDQDGATAGMQNTVGYGIYNQAAAITSITLVPGAAFTTGTYTLYGVK